jgi:hypothetical protein
VLLGRWVQEALQTKKRNTFVHSQFRPLVLIFALAAMASALLAGCGGNDEDVDKVLRETFSGRKQVNSGKLKLGLKVDAEGLPQLRDPVELTLSGPFQSQGQRRIPKFDFSLVLSAGDNKFRAGAVSTGDRGFVKLQGNSYTVSEQIFAGFRRGFEQASPREGNRQNPTFASLGINPRNWLRDAKNEGEEEVGGTETIHVSAKVDVGRMLDDVSKLLQRAGQLGVAQARQIPSTLSDQQKRQIQQAVDSASFNVYTGKDDKILRKLQVKLGFKLSGQQRQQAGGLREGTLTFTLEVDDLNQNQSVNAPANPKPFSELARAFSGLGALGRGGAGGGAGAQGGGATTTPPAGGSSGGSGNAQVQAYAQCIQQAQGDAAKAQACARLLTPGG